MLEKEIRSELSSLKEKLKEERAKLGEIPLNTTDAKKWKSFLKTIEDDVKIVNKKINDYNLIVPLLNKQMVHVNIGRLAERCLVEQPSNAVVGSTSEASRAQSAKAPPNAEAAQFNIVGYLLSLWR